MGLEEDTVGDVVGNTHCELFDDAPPLTSSRPPGATLSRMRVPGTAVLRTVTRDAFALSWRTLTHDEDPESGGAASTASPGKKN